MGQQTVRPAIPTAHDAGQPANLGCSRWSLRVDQARGHLVPIGKRAALCLSQATRHQIGQPTVQFVHANSDPLGSLRRPHRGSLRVDDGPLVRGCASSVGWDLVTSLRSGLAGLAGLAWLAGLAALAGLSGLSGRACRADLRRPGRQPRRGLGRRRCVNHLNRSPCPKKEQGQRMLTGELPARAAAAVRRPGRVDNYAIGSLGASSASPPHRSVVMTEL